MSDVLDWARWPNFSESEFACKCGTCGGKADMKPEFLDKLQAVRNAVGFPMTITSGYRCAAHKKEAKKPRPGAHGCGVAADIACDGRNAFLIEQAFILIQKEAGDDRVGLGRSQKPGQARFVHLDCHDHPARPNVWSY